MKCEMQLRRPFPVYELTHEDRKAFLIKSEDTGVRCKRWSLKYEDGNQDFFKSKRAAVHFFRTGEKFKTKPVYANRGKAQKRIR